MANHEYIDDMIRSRRTIKIYKEDPISTDLIKEILSVAVWAPNHKLREPWRFIAFVGDGRQVFLDALIKEKESGRFPRPMKPEKLENIKKTPAFLLVVMPVDPRHNVFEEDYAAVSACIQNIQLAAWARGVGALWITEPMITNPVFREPLGVKSDEKIVGILHLGYPEVVPNAQPRTPIEEKLTIIEQ